MRIKDRLHLLKLPNQFDPCRVREIASALGFSYKQTLQFLAHQRWQQQRTPLKGEKCCARTRAGSPCKAPARANGRCRMHGGLSTGATSPAGQMRSYGHARVVDQPAIVPKGRSHPDLFEHIAVGGELSHEQRLEIMRPGRYDVLTAISVLEVADIVISDDLNILSEAMMEGLLDPAWFDRWFARKRIQVEEQDLLRLKLVRAERLEALSRALWG